MDFIDSIKKTKEDSFILASLPEEIRNDALERMTKALQANKEAIFEANARDLELAKEAGLPAPIVNRLVFDSHKMKSCIDGIYDLIDMEDPLFQDLLKRELDTDLILTKTTCPIGVIGVIFESRTGCTGTDRSTLHQKRQLLHLKRRQRSQKHQPHLIRHHLSGRHGGRASGRFRCPHRRPCQHR